jgi:hypothetical protein
MRRLNLEVVEQGNNYALAAESNNYDRIVTAQRNGEDIQIIKQKLAKGDPKYTCFQKDHKNVIWFGKRLVVPVNPEIKKTIFDEAHMSNFSDSTMSSNFPPQIIRSKECKSLTALS